MATMHTRASHSFIFDEVVSAVAYNEFEQNPLMFPRLFAVRPAAKGRRERTASIGGLGQFQEKNEGANATQDNTVQQFEKTFTHTAFALYGEISREAIDDNDFGLFQSLGEQFGMSAARTMETQAADVFNNAFTTELAEDGLSVCNSAHLNVDSGNSQDNSGTSALSHANVATTRQTMRKFTDYRGEKCMINPDGLLVPVDLEETAWEIVRSTGRSDTTNNAANVFNGMFDLFVWRFLSDTGNNNWFMLDQRLMKKNLMWLQRAPLEIFGDGDLIKQSRTIGAYYRESHGVKDWRWVYGQLVT